MLASRLQSHADAARRAADRVRQKVDAPHIEAGGQCDGLDAVKLIEAVAVVVVDPGNDALRRFIVEPPPQRLIAKDGVGLPLLL